jgi:hypothetical protein
MVDVVDHHPNHVREVSVVDTVAAQRQAEIAPSWVGTQMIGRREVR